MSLLNTTLQMQNKMSSPIMEVIGSLNQLTQSAVSAQKSLSSMMGSAGGGLTGFDMSDEIGRNIQGQEEFNRELEKSNSLGSTVKSTIGKIAGAYAGIQGIKAFVGVADEMTLTNARLESILRNSETLESVQGKIFASAQRSRGDYMETLSAVSKLGAQAGEAFNSTDEIIMFTEQMNKHFVTSGASIEGAKSAMYQLNQAMAMGVLRGEEFNAIRENAPSVVQAIADYMGVAKGEVKKLADEGKLSADIVKNSLLASADAIDEAFGKIPMTFGQIKQAVKNEFIGELQPALAKFNEFLNSESFVTFTHTISGAMGTLASVIGITVELFVDGFNAMAGAMDVLQYPIYTIIGLLTLYNSLLVLKKFLEITNKISSAIMEKGLWGAVRAQITLNNAMMANPIALVIGAIIILIGVLNFVIALINKVKGTSYTVIGSIMGMVYAAGASIYNVAMWLYNAVGETFVNIRNAGAKVSASVANAFSSAWNHVVRTFGSMASKVLSGLDSIASRMDEVFGTNFSSGTSAWIASANALANSSPKTYSYQTKQFQPKKLKDIGEAFDKGHAIGTNFGNKVKDKVKDFAKDKLGLDKEKDKEKDPLQAMDNLAGMTKAIENAQNSLTNPSKAMGKDMGKVADNTKQIKDTLENSIEFKNEDLEYLRELATERAISQYSLDKVMVEVNNSFGDIHETADLDGWQSSVADGLLEAVKTSIGGGGVVAEGS